MSSEELNPVVATEVTHLEELQKDADFRATMASAAQSMDNAGVFNVLTGWPAVSILCNVPIMPDMTFLVPDDKVQQAIDALVATLGYHRCVCPRCPELNEDRFPDQQLAFNPVRFHTVGAVHFHTGTYRFPLTLYPMSKMLWWLRDLNHESLYLTLASECELAPWAGLYPVRVLKQRTFVESLILCRCRDYGRNPRLDLLWDILLVLLIEPRVDLVDEFMPFWLAFTDPDKVHDTDALLCELRDKLTTTDDGLPAHPAHCPGSG